MAEGTTEAGNSEAVTIPGPIPGSSRRSPVERATLTRAWPPAEGQSSLIYDTTLLPTRTPYWRRGQRAGSLDAVL